jgi:hypothetical protein
MYLSPSVTQLLDDISDPEVIAVHDEKAVAPTIAAEFEVLALTVTVDPDDVYESTPQADG